MEDKKTNKTYNYFLILLLCYAVASLIVPVIGEGKKYTFEEGAAGQIGQSVYFSDGISKGTLEFTGAVKTGEMELDDYFIGIADKDTVFFTNRLMNIMQCERNGYIVFSVKRRTAPYPTVHRCPSSNRKNTVSWTSRQHICATGFSATASKKGSHISWIAVSVSAGRYSVFSKKTMLRLLKWSLQRPRTVSSVL